MGTLIIIKHQFTSCLAYKFHVFLVKVSLGFRSLIPSSVGHLKVCVGFPWWSGGEDSVLPTQGLKVQSLIGELRSHMPNGTAKKKKVCGTRDYSWSVGHLAAHRNCDKRKSHTNFQNF